MKIKITCDTDQASGLEPLAAMLQKDGYEERLSESEYGEGVYMLCCSVRCLPHSYQRLNPKILNGTVHVTVDLDYSEFTSAGSEDSKKLLGTRINDKVRQAFAKIAMPSAFDASRFLDDHKRFLRRRGWL